MTNLVAIDGGKGRKSNSINLSEVANGGGPPYDGDMEARVAKLESIAEKTSERLATLEKDVAVIKSNYATKADVSDAKNSIIMWVVSAILLAQLLPAILKKFGM
jgi:hypothetical protein